MNTSENNVKVSPYFFMWCLVGALAGRALAYPLYGWMNDHFEFMRYHPVVVMDNSPIVQISPVAAATPASATQSR
jgi:hypothetical protein